MTDRMAPEKYLHKMLAGIGPVHKYDESPLPCHFNSLGLTKSIPLECGLSLLALVRWYRPGVIVEVGTFRGYSTAWLILGTLLNQYGDVFSYDIKPEGFFGRLWYDHYELPQDRYKFVHSPGGIWEMYNENLPPSIDLVFHDSSHELEDTQRELDVLIPRMSAKGVMIFDDFLHPLYKGMRDVLYERFNRDASWKWTVVPVGTGWAVAERK